MNETALKEWLAQPRTDLSAAVARAIQAHVASLESRGIDFYGYALLPGEEYDINSLVAVVNGASDIKVGPDDDQYHYCRYCVDEWEHWEHDGFDEVNQLLAEANSQFSKMHVKGNDDCAMKEFEIAHSDSSLEAILRGLETAKAKGAFEDRDMFLAIWISDSDHEIMAESVRRLNSENVAIEFSAEFG